MSDKERVFVLSRGSHAGGQHNSLKNGFWDAKPPKREIVFMYISKRNYLPPAILRIEWEVAGINLGQAALYIPGDH